MNTADAATGEKHPFEAAAARTSDCAREGTLRDGDKNTLEKQSVVDCFPNAQCESGASVEANDAATEHDAPPNVTRVVSVAHGVDDDSDGARRRRRESDANARRALEVLALLLLSLLGGEEHPEGSLALIGHRQLTNVVFSLFGSVLFNVHAYGLRGVVFTAEMFFPLPVAFLNRHEETTAVALETLDGWRWLARGCPVEAAEFEECRKLMALAERDGEAALDHALDFASGLVLQACEALGAPQPSLRANASLVADLRGSGAL